MSTARPTSTMPIQFDIADNVPECMSMHMLLAYLKDIFSTPEGKRLICKSMTSKPLSKENQRKEMDWFRKYFCSNKTNVSNLKSCLIVKREKGAFNHIKWRDSSNLLETFQFSRLAPCAGMIVLQLIQK